MKPTRLSDLVLIAIVVAASTWVLVRAFYGVVTPVSLLAGVSLLLLAAVEVGLAVVLRGRIERRPGAQRLDPIMAARSVALAKASALAGSTMVGVWSGALAYLLPRRTELAAAGQDLPGAVVGVVCAALLVVAALVLEHVLRTPDDFRATPRD